MRRAMHTMLLGYPKMIERLTAEGKRPILLDILQETGGWVLQRAHGVTADGQGIPVIYQPIPSKP